MVPGVVVSSLVPPGLVGRAPELKVLDGLLAGVADSCGEAVWVEGAAGIGKSALVGELAARARESGCRVLRGVGVEVTGVFPLRVMAECLGVSGAAGAGGAADAAADGAADPARAEIAGLLRGGGGLGVVDPVLAAGERMLDLVDRLCARGPVVLILEDLQWTDEASARLWGRLARAVDQIPLLLVGTVRSGPGGRLADGLRGLVRARDGVVLEVGPLSAQESVELAGRLAGGRAGPRLRAEVGRAGGNPLFVRELVAALVEDGLVQRVGGPAGGAGRGVLEFVGGEGVVPGSLVTAVGRRLVYLSDSTLRMLQVAALMGVEFDAGPLGLAVGLSVGELADALAEAVQAGVLDDRGERLVFNLVLIQQVLVEQVPRALAGVLHQRLARVLADAGCGVNLVARHLLATPGMLDGWAVEWLCGVEESVLGVVPRMWAQLLGRVVGTTGVAGTGGSASGAQWETLAGRLVQVLFALGRDEQVLEVAEELARTTGDRELAARGRVFAVRSLGRLGRSEDALALAAQVLQDEGLPPVWRARLEALSAIQLTNVGRSQDRRAAARALDLALRTGDPLTIAYGRHAASYGAATEAAVEHTAQGIAVLGTDPESMDLRMILTRNRLTLLMQLGRMDQYRAELPRALALGERVGTVRAAGLLGGAAGVSYLYGDWDEAVVYLSGIEPEFSATPYAVHLHGIGALIGVHRGDRALAAAHFGVIDDVLGKQAPRGGLRAVYVFAARALSAEADGDLDRALALSAHWLELPEGLRRSECADEAPDLVRLALAKGDLATARAAVAAIEQEARADPLPNRVAAARTCRAMLAHDAPALAELGQLYQGYGWPLQTGFALEEAAARFAAAGDVARARCALAEAVRAYSGLAAQWDVRRADARLRALGVRRGPRSAHRRESTGWAALTPGERRVAGLVGQGWSNPDIAAELFLSRRTVQTHVSNILAKLQLRSRTEVARVLAQVDPAVLNA